MRPKPRAAIISRALGVAMLMCASLTPYSASASPTLPRRDERPVEPRTIVVGRAGSDRASLETTSPSIPADDAFGFTGRVSLATPADYVRMRFRVSHPSGRLIFQRTRIFNEVEPGIVASIFERGTDDLGLRPGVFPVELEVAVGRGGGRADIRITTGLLVYDGETPGIAATLVTRVSGQPLSDPSGRFIADPGRYTRARDDVHTLAAWVLEKPAARVTLAIPPVLVEEWRRIAAGYEFAGPEGVESIGPESAVPQEYAAALRILDNALATGRLELASLGYADPDLSDLAAARLLDDVLPQYERGLSASFASLETTTSTGTVPAGGCVPPAAAPLLANAGIRYVVVGSDCTRSGDGTAAPSSYRTAGGLVALVPDEEISRAASSGDTSATVHMAFDRLLDEDATGPLVLAADLGAGGADVARLTASVDVLATHPWVRMAVARDVAARPRRSVRLTAGEGNDGDPPGYWNDVRVARLWSGALVAALGEGDPEAATALRDSLIAECAAWAGVDGEWALADRGRSFADTARRLSGETLDAITLAVEPITLAGTRGDVPVTIRNRTDRTLNVRLEVKSSGGVRVFGPASRDLQLGPKETFFEIPVDMSNVLAGRLRVEVIAGDLVIDSASVTLRASYLDRIAMVAGVLLLLGILLAFIIRRVRLAERGASAAESPEAYTGPTGVRRIGGRE